MNTVNSLNRPIAANLKAQSETRATKGAKEGKTDFASELLGAGASGDVSALVEIGAEKAQARPGEKSERKSAGNEAGAAAEMVQINAVVPKVLPRPEASAEVNALNSRSEKSRLRAGSLGERSPLTTQSAASLNTAAAIAGLTPWSRDWVFQGEGQPNPDLKPIFGNPEKATPETIAGDGLVPGLPGLEEAKTPKGKFPISGSKAALDEATFAQVGASVRQVRGDTGLVSPTMENGRDRTSVLALSGEQKAAASSETMVDDSGVADGMGLAHGVEMQVSQKPAQSALQTSLSGGEFLNTLNAVKDGKAEADAGNNGNSGEGRGFNSRPDLRLVPGGALKPGDKKTGFGEALSANPAVHVFGNREAMGPQTIHPRPLEVTGHTAKGAMARDRLSHEALLGVGTNIRELSLKGGGEMRVRLKPDDLGELHLRVMTRGNSVGLQIQASDERAKKVIEDSMVHLKESLANQNLNLSRVELTVAPSSNGAAGGDARNDQQQQAGNSFHQDLMGQNSGQNAQGRSDWGRFDGWDGNASSSQDTRRKTVVGTRAEAMGVRSVSDRPRAMASGRLDVRA